MIGAHITSYARTEMHKAILACQAQNIQIYYMDTDSLIITRLKDQALPLQINNSIFGCYKKEILDDIETFYSLG